MPINEISQAANRMLEELASSELCSHVGDPFYPEFFRSQFRNISSWDIAKRISKSVDTANFYTSISNQDRRIRCDRGIRIYGKRFSHSKFNPWVASIRQPVGELIRTCVDRINLSSDVKECIYSEVYAIAFGAVIQIHWNDLMPEKNISGYLLDIILKGHFVAGWEGDYPEGHLAIY